MNQLLGVILCGGESKRMGSDKGLLPIRDTIWAAYAGAKLDPFQIPAVYSVNEQQVKNYSTYFSSGQLVIDKDLVKGPLNGLLSVQQHFPGKDLLLLACDMLDMDTSTIDFLLQVYRTDNSYDFYVYQDIEYAQPFCGIYSGIGLAKTESRLLSGQLERFSLQAVLNNGNTKRIPIKDRSVFKNYNERTKK